MEQGGVRVLDKALTLLEQLAPTRVRDTYGVVELAEQAGIPVSTAHRILQVLKKHGFAAQTSDKRYQLGLKLMELGMKVWESLDLRSVAHPLMEELAAELEESIYLTVRDGGDGVHVERVESPLNLRITEPIGLRLPLCCGASRLAILAFLSPGQAEAIVARADEDRRAALARELTAIAGRGWALTRGEVTAGTTGVAVPVTGYRGEPIASLSAAGPERRFPPERVGEIARRLAAAVALIEARYGVARRPV